MWRNIAISGWWICPTAWIPPNRDFSGGRAFLSMPLWCWLPPKRSGSKRLLSDSLPVVAAGGDWPADQIPIVAFDGGDGGEMAIEHLIRRKPASLAHFEFLIDGFEVLGQRLALFPARWNATGHPCDESSAAPSRRSGPHLPRTTESPARAHRGPGCCDILRGLDLPAGVWCGDDHLGLRVCEVAEGLGFAIPEDLAVLGLGDLRCAISGRPPLSSIPASGCLDRLSRPSRLWIGSSRARRNCRPSSSISPPSVVARESTVGAIGADFDRPGARADRRSSLRWHHRG